jgi:hypothetical protein
MIFGSLIPSAKAITDPTTSSRTNAQIRDIFIEVFLFTKGISLGNLLPALGECGEGSSFSGAGQAEISRSQKISGEHANCCAQSKLTCANLCTCFYYGAPREPQKSRSPKAPAVQLVVCPDKN